MGIFKAIGTSVKGELAEQWLEAFMSEGFEGNTLVKRGHKFTSQKSSNKKGSGDIITNGSKIIVNDGECAIATENGKIIGVYKEPGENKFDSENSPGVFGGDGLKPVIKSAWDRIGFGGDIHISQRIYYVNTKEIVGLSFEVKDGFPVRVVDENLNLDIDVTAICQGTYSFRITDPEKFFTNVARKNNNYVNADMLRGHFEQELLSVLQPVIAEAFKNGGRPNELPALIPEIKERVTEEISALWSELRGISVVSIAFSTLSLEAEERKMISDLQREAMLKDPVMAAAALSRAEADAMTLAAKNSAGVKITSSMIFDEAYKKNTLWRCPSCGNMITSNFCEACGTKRP